MPTGSRSRRRIKNYAVSGETNLLAKGWGQIGPLAFRFETTGRSLQEAKRRLARSGECRNWILSVYPGWRPPEPLACEYVLLAWKITFGRQSGSEWVTPVCPLAWDESPQLFAENVLELPETV